jgi:hypothetical protein
MSADNEVGRPRGLTRDRLDRLALPRSERGTRRGDDAHAQALKRLELLLHHSGGIYFGNDLKSQLRLASPNARIRARQLVTLRFCCQGWCFAFVREGLQRYPIEHTRLTLPLPGDTWWRTSTCAPGCLPLAPAHASNHLRSCARSIKSGSKGSSEQQAHIERLEPHSACRKQF